MSECPTLASPDPVFLHPWHAQIFALTVSLNESGHFIWADWVTQFSATLARHGLDRDLDGGDDYFNAWLETLELILAAQGAAAPEDVERLRADWEQAYLNTPHGAVVRLTDA